VRTPYDNVAKALIHHLKFDRAQAAAADIAETLIPLLPKADTWVLCHIPTAPSRVRVRGYDQSQRIAQELSRRAGIPWAHLLARAHSVRQLGQNRAIRKEQISDAFRISSPQAVRGKHILLVDDVITTGATCEAAAKALHAAGAASVSAVVFAAA